VTTDSQIMWMFSWTGNSWVTWQLWSPLENWFWRALKGPMKEPDSQADLGPAQFEDW